MEGKGEITLLEDMSVYQLQTEIADEIWEIVKNWSHFEKDTVGKQLTRAFDSVGANIAEGYGRFHYGDKIKFFYYARGSALESQYWIKRARSRRLMKEAVAHQYLTHLAQINKELNMLIKTYKSKR